MPLRSQSRTGIITRGNYAGVDQGVDFTGRGMVPAFGDATIRGIRHVHIIEGGSWPYIWYHVHSGPLQGRDIYLMENIEPLVHPGQRVMSGQPIARAKGAYPYIETGFDTGHGEPLAKLGSTDKGTEMWHLIQEWMKGGGGGTPKGEHLEQLWLGAGGPPHGSGHANLAQIMAAIALAESGGNPHARLHTSREDSRGLWAINIFPNANPQYAHWNLYDPTVNAKAAVAIYRSAGLGAWSTYTSGKYKRFMKQAPGSTTKWTRSRPGAGGAPAGGGGETAAQHAAARRAAQKAWGEYQGSQGAQVAPAGHKPTGGPQDAAFFYPVHGASADQRQFAAWYDWIPTPIAPIPGEGPLLGIPSPLDIFGSAGAAVSGIDDMAHWVAWFFHPQHLFRLGEFIVGAGLLAMGLTMSASGFRAVDAVSLPGRLIGGEARRAIRGRRVQTIRRRYITTTQSDSPQRAARTGERAAGGPLAEERLRTQRARTQNIRARTRLQTETSRATRGARKAGEARARMEGRAEASRRTTRNTRRNKPSAKKTSARKKAQVKKTTPKPKSPVSAAREATRKARSSRIARTIRFQAGRISG